MIEPGRVLALVAACVLAPAVCLLAFASPAHGALSWTGPTTIDPSPVGAVGLSLACPSATQCTVVDPNEGQSLPAPSVEVTFDPSAPGSPTPVTIDAGGDLTSVVCPSVNQCTAIVNGDEVTFDPSSPGSPTPVTVDPTGAPLYSVACPTTTQCTAVDEGHDEVTFNPQAPGSPTPVAIDNSPNVLVEQSSIACPTVRQCTIAYFPGHEVTFDPLSPGTPTPVTIDPGCGAGSGVTFGGPCPDAIACPSTSQCTAVDQAGGEITFDPLAPGSPGPGAIDTRTAAISGVACPELNLCVAVDDSGNALAGDPATPSSFAATALPNQPILDAVACPAVTECVAVDDAGEVFVGTPGKAGAGGSTVTGALTGLALGHPKVTLRLAQGGDPAPAAKVTIALPAGMSFSRRAFATHKRCHGAGSNRKCAHVRSLSGLSIAGARLRSATLRSGKLVLVLANASSNVWIKLAGSLLAETNELRTRARKGTGPSLELTLALVDQEGHSSLVPVSLTSS